MLDVGVMVGQALEVLPIPFLALETVRDPATGREDLSVVWANGPAQERFGDALVGSWLDRDAPFGSMESVVPETLLSQTGSRLRVVERPVDQDGRTEHLRCTLIPVEQGAAIMIEDITSEIEARAELALADKTLARVERWGNLGVWEVDLVTQSAYWSTQVYEILGIEDHGLDAFFHVVHPDDLPLVRHVLGRAMDQPGPYRLTHRVLRGEEVRTVDQHMQSVPDREGRPARLIGTMIDVTTTSALRQQLHQTQQMRTMGLLAGGLAHDFNNVLLVIRGHADVLLRQTDPDDRSRPSLEAISRAGDRASTLTRKLMALGRQDELRPTRVSPVGFLHEVAELVRPAVEPAVSVDVDVDPNAESIELLADVDHLRQVVLDLVLNARDADCSNIVLRLGDQHVDPSDPHWVEAAIPAGHYGIVQVIDDGTGMDEATRRRIFDPFFTTKDASSGSGLGLANAQSFAQRSLGALLVSTEPGQGSTLSLLLPASVRPDPTTGPSRRRRSPTRVLLATHDRDRAQRVTAVLEELGHQVVWVTELDAMTFSLESEPIDLVVLDDALVIPDTVQDVFGGIPMVVITKQAGSNVGVPHAVSVDSELALEDAVTTVLASG